MAIKTSGSQPSVRPPAEHFTGTVRIDPLFQSSAPARAGGAYVTFEPCARSDWHTHPLGQTLIVLDGVGWTQVQDGPVQEFAAGDILLCPADRRHWQELQTFDLDA